MSQPGVLPAAVIKAVFAPASRAAASARTVEVDSPPWEIAMHRPLLRGARAWSADSRASAGPAATGDSPMAPLRISATARTMSRRAHRRHHDRLTGTDGHVQHLDKPRR